MVVYLKLKYPDKDENTLRDSVKQVVRDRINKLKANNKKALEEGLTVEEAVKKYGKIYPTVKMVQATDPASPNPRKKSYGNLVEVPNMDILKFGSVYNDKIMSPFCSVYETTFFNSFFMLVISFSIISSVKVDFSSWNFIR